MQEQRDIPGYAGHYTITRDGRIWSVKTCLWMKPEITDTGYLRVRLRRDGAQHKFKVHRLVAIVWIANPKNRPQINHLNGDKLDNRDINLEWVTGSENMKHAVRAGLVILPHQRTAHQ